MEAEGGNILILRLRQPKTFRLGGVARIEFRKHNG